MNNAKPLVAVIMGSHNDIKVVRPALDTLEKFGITYEARVMSAHRTPDIVAEFVGGLYDRGFKAVIAAAGKAAHLAGAAAARTVLPIIGIPVSATHLDGMDALLATVQMPPGLPVATVAIDGAVNAALLAISIIGAFEPDVYAKLVKYRDDMAAAVMAKDTELFGSN